MRDFLSNVNTACMLVICIPLLVVIYAFAFISNCLDDLIWDGHLNAKQNFKALLNVIGLMPNFIDENFDEIFENNDSTEETES